jgi:hypothetical protein
MFVKCTLLIDEETEQIAFTGCTFKDCNLDRIDADEARGVVSRDNTFERPLDEQRKDFEHRLAVVLSKRMPKPT